MLVFRVLLQGWQKQVSDSYPSAPQDRPHCHYDAGIKSPHAVKFMKTCWWLKILRVFTEWQGIYSKRILSNVHTSVSQSSLIKLNVSNVSTIFKSNFNFTFLNLFCVSIPFFFKSKALPHQPLILTVFLPLLACRWRRNLTWPTVTWVDVKSRLRSWGRWWRPPYCM